jgi:hypothetical protein
LALVRQSVHTTPLNESFSSAPNTTIRSRVLGKPLMPRFPSPLPSDTVLDCVLDQNWKENGILHVLDVIKWKGQDIADCESSFRSAACFIPGKGRTSLISRAQVLVERHAFIGAAALAPSDNACASHLSPSFNAGR